MENIFRSLLKRIKRAIPLIIVIPLLLAGFGYFLEVQSKPIVTYTGEAKIQLGYYEDVNLNDSDTAKTILTSHNFLSNTFSDYDETEIQSLKNSIKVNTPTGTKLNIKYEGKSEEEIRGILSELVNGFLLYDKQKFEEKYSVLEENYEQLNEESVSQDSKVDKQRFIYELQNELLSIYPAELADSISISEYRMEDFSAKKRAVLGGLIGITIVFGFIVIPILFKEDTY